MLEPNARCAHLSRSKYLGLPAFQRLPLELVQRHSDEAHPPLSVVASCAHSTRTKMQQKTLRTALKYLVCFRQLCSARRQLAWPPRRHCHHRMVTLAYVRALSPDCATLNVASSAAVDVVDEIVVNGRLSSEPVSDRLILLPKLALWRRRMRLGIDADQA